MRELGVVLLMLASVSVGCLDGSSPEEVSPASNGSAPEFAANESGPREEASGLTWHNESHEGTVAGTEQAGMNVNVEPLSENTRFPLDVRSGTEILRLNVTSDFGLEVHLSPPSCEHGRLDDCHREAKSYDDRFTWSTATPTEGSWQVEVHAPHAFSLQPFTIEVGLATTPTNASTSD